MLTRTQPVDQAADLLALGLGLSGLWSVLRSFRRAPREPRRVLRSLLRPLRGGLSLLGFSVALATSSAAAQSRPASPPGRSTTRSPEPPRSRTSGPPPPSPLVLTGDRAGGPATAQRSSPGPRVVVHPAVHSRRSPRRAPALLFPRAGERRDPRKARARFAHPAGKGLGDDDFTSEAVGRIFGYHNDRSEGLGRDDATSRDAGPRGCKKHTVRWGESLWSIAEAALGTEDPARVAGYWPRIYRANRSIVGSDEDLIFPGEVLELPPECGA
jgi:nucleoid-associated protein YgaU